MNKRHDSPAGRPSVGGALRVPPRGAFLRALTVCLLAAGLAACASQRPVLYPNDHLLVVGSAEAEMDIDACMSLARDYGAASAQGREVAQDTATGAAVGGATGAAVGAVVGNLGRGAAAGAAGGAAGALTRSVIHSGKPDPVFRQFVERCLRERGYEPIGWR